MRLIDIKWFDCKTKFRCQKLCATLTLETARALRSSTLHHSRPQIWHQKVKLFVLNFDRSNTFAAMNGQYLCNRPITCSYAFKKDTKGERHGTAAERLLAAQNPLFPSDRPHQIFSDIPGLRYIIIRIFCIIFWYFFLHYNIKTECKKICKSKISIRKLQQNQKSKPEHGDMLELDCFWHYSTPFL